MPRIHVALRGKNGSGTCILPESFSVGGLHEQDFCRMVEQPPEGYFLSVFKLTEDQGHWQAVFRKHTPDTSLAGVTVSLYVRE